MKRKNTLSVYAVCSILILGVISPAFTFEPAFATTPILYGIDGAAGNLDPELYIIDQTSGTAVSVGAIGVADLAGCGAMDAHPVTGVLWALCENDGIAVPADAGKPMLITINPATGAGTKIADVSGSLFLAGSFRIFDMSFENGGVNTLYVVALDPAGSVAVELHTLALTGVSTKTIPGDLMPPGGAAGGNGLAFSPTDTLFHIDLTNFSTLTLGTGAAAALAGTTWSQGATNFLRDNAMDFEPGTGILFSSTNDGPPGLSAATGPNWLSTVNTVTGLVSIVGPTQIGLDAIAFIEEDDMFEECFVHVEWDNPLFLFPGSPPTGNPPIVFDDDCVGGTFNQGQPAELLCVPTQVPEPAFLCIVQVPNFIDDLDLKTVIVDITYDPNGPPPNTFDDGAPATGPPFIIPTDPDLPGPGGQGTPDDCPIVDQGEVDEQNPGVYFYEFECRPNPDWEQLQFFFHPNVQKLEIWTTSFDDPKVGGTFIPIDTSSLLLAGAQSISMWMIPVILAGIGIGIFVIKRRN